MEKNNITSLIETLDRDGRQKLLEELSISLTTDEIKKLHNVKKESNKTIRKQNSLKKWRKTWKTLRCKESDLEGAEWVNDWWKNNKINKRNYICKGYQDIVLGCESTNRWTAITGTDCEWFEEQVCLQAMIELVRYHNSSGVDNWGTGTVGGSHEYVNRVFISANDLKHFEGEEQLNALKKRYKIVYILDYYNPINR